MNILLISDDIPGLDQLEKMLEKSALDHVRIEKFSLQDAFKLKLTPEMADIVIFAFPQNEIDDFENVHILKTYSAFFPVLVLIDHEREDFWQWILKTGAQDYLVKNQYNEWILFKTIRQAVYRKNIEDELRESQRSHATLLSNLPGLVYRCLNDRYWTMEFVSQGCYELTGYRSNSLINNRDLAYGDLILEEDQECVWVEIQKALKESRHFEIDYRIRTAEGEIKFVREKGVGVYSEDGSLTMLEGFIIDVSRTIRTQQQLSRSENRFRSLVESIDDIVFRMDPDKRISGVFGKWKKNLGINSGDLLGMPVGELFTNANETIDPDIFINILNGEHNSFEWKFDFEGRSRDYLISLSPLLDENGEVYGLVGVGRDITRLKQTENALRDSQVLAQSIADSINEEICVIDSEGKIIAVNTAWKKLNDRLKKNLSVGQAYFSLFKEVLELDAENGKKVEDGIHSVLDAKKTEFLIEYPSFSVETNNWFQLRAFPLHNHRTGAVIMRSNISERKRYELEQTAIIAIYAAMRTFLDREKLLETIQKEVCRLLDSESIAIVTYDSRNEKFLVENAKGIWAEFLGKQILCSQKSVCKHVLETGVSYLINKSHLETVPFVLNFDVSVNHLICVPMEVSQERLGVIWVGSNREITQFDVSQLENIAVLAAASIRQLNLFEQTLQRLRYLNALRKIDQTILSSLDRKIILDAILGQVMEVSEKGSLAVNILTYDKGLNRLECLTSGGFEHTNMENTWFIPDSKSVPFSFIQKEIIVLKDLSPGSEFIKKRGLALENFRVYYSLPMIAKGKLVGALEVYSRKADGLDQETLEFLSSIADQTSIALNSIEMFENLRSKNLELVISYDTTIKAWSKTLDLRDEEFNKHTARVTQMTIALAKEMGVRENDLIHLQRGALLHDIGKIGIPDEILFKPGPLNEEEWVIIRQHPIAAYDLLSPVQFLREALDIPYCHHEKWDGTGYPQGLAGEQIPLAARIFAIIDVWDALLSEKPYRKAWSNKKTIDYIRSQSGIHFDPRVVEAFSKMLKNYNEDEYRREA